MIEMNITHSSRIFSTVLATLVTAILASDLHAGASNKNGNPFGNGTFFSNTATFSAVVRGANLSGTIYFSTGGNSTGGSQGSSLIVYQGNTYDGNASGMWNPSSSVISGQIWGGQTLSGQGSNTIYPELYNTNLRTNYTYNTNGTISTTNVGYYFPYAISVSSNYVGTNSTRAISPNGDITTTSTLTNLLVTNTVYLEPTGANTYNDSVYMNGNFYGNVQNSYPNQTFSANGTLSRPNYHSSYLVLVVRIRRARFLTEC